MYQFKAIPLHPSFYRNFLHLVNSILFQIFQNSSSCEMTRRSHPFLFSKVSLKRPWNYKSLELSEIYSRAKLNRTLSFNLTTTSTEDEWEFVPLKRIWTKRNRKRQFTVNVREVSRPRKCYLGGKMDGWVFGWHRFSTNAWVNKMIIFSSYYVTISFSDFHAISYLWMIFRDER
jgi:hypothetical protein